MVTIFHFQFRGTQKCSSDLKIMVESLEIEDYWIAMGSDYNQLSVRPSSFYCNL